MTPPGIKVLDLQQIGWTTEIEETADSLEGNALLKAYTVSDELEIDCFAEDTGLEVDVLDGKPGVFSARYAGEHRNAHANMEKLLIELEGIENRQAQFRTVIALILDGASFCFHGIVRGQIAHSASGDGGFGYDPVFIPDGYTASFGELSSDVKNRMSHRAQAMQQLTAFLTTYLKCKNQGLAWPRTQDLQSRW